MNAKNVLSMKDSTMVAQLYEIYSTFDSSSVKLLDCQSLFCLESLCEKGGITRAY